jgi:hypothetical protein
MNPGDIRYRNVFGQVGFVIDEVRESGCTQEEAQQRWNEYWSAKLPGRAERQRIVEKIASQHGLTGHEASAVLFSFEALDSSDGQDLH